MKLTVQSKVKNYTVEQGQLDISLNHTIEYCKIGKSFLIIDRQIKVLHKKAFANFPNAIAYEVTASEQTKSLAEVEKIALWLLENNVTRNDTLIAIGGGITLDVTAFLAGTILRGINWISIPTTLLAQSDSCIGGKSSINIGKYKNMLGTITPPASVFIDSTFLQTLDDTNLCSGLGEIIKAHILSGEAETNWIEENIDLLVNSRTSTNWPKTIEHAIFTSLQYKKRCIEADEFDNGERRLLNYGHSFGHALESAANFTLPHGIAITIGMEIANFVALRLGMLSEDVYERLRKIIRSNLNFTNGKVLLDRNQFTKSLLRDKKNNEETINLVLLHGKPGNALVTPIKDKKLLIELCDIYFAANSVNINWENHE